MTCPHCGSDAGVDTCRNGLFCLDCGKDTMSENRGPIGMALGLAKALVEDRPDYGDDPKQDIAASLRYQDKHILYLKGKLAEVAQVRDEAKWADGSGTLGAGDMAMALTKILEGVEL